MLPLITIPPNEEQAKNILAITQKLLGLKIKAEFRNIEVGPVVTGYFFRLDSTESVSRIIKKTEDIAFALDVEKVIIQRIKGLIAVFIPNKERHVINFKDILYWYLHDPVVGKMKLPIPIGMDTSGKTHAFDLYDMPHALITGSTGSGKSVFTAAMICSLAYFKDSSELQYYLVDTKKLDLPLFTKLPHSKQVADDLEHFHNMFSNIMLMTRSRLATLQAASVRNIHEYHVMNDNKISIMPYTIVIIDEYGDLVDLDTAARKAGQFEDTPSVPQWVKSLSQIGRAAGVHLIVCTQRSSVKIVSGDLKANLPCRITFRLPTLTDSRTILDEGGAENLLGKGDMLIKRPEMDSIQRFHGPFVSGEDIKQIVNQYEYLKNIL